MKEPSTCPFCGLKSYALGPHKRSSVCTAKQLTKQLRAEGFESIAGGTVLAEAYTEKLRAYGIEVRVEQTSYTPHSGAAETRFKSQVWAPAWALAIVWAEPMLPDAKEAAMRAALVDPELRAAVCAVFVLGDRYNVAVYLQERFG